MEMQDKPKRRTRSSTAKNGSGAVDTPTEAKPRRGKTKKETPVVEAAPVSVEVPVEERLGATVPLPPVLERATSGNGGTTFNGGITTPQLESAQNAAMIAPRKIVCQQVEAAYLSDVGMMRDNNEDSASAFLSTISRLNAEQELVFGFLAVADGMGGHEHGEVASNLAVRRMSEGVLQQFYLPTLEGRQPGRPGESPMDVLSGLIQDAHQSILQEAHETRSRAMGTTLTCAVLIGQTAFVGHVGDSRLYVLEKSSRQLRLVTHDHSVVQRLVDTGVMTEEEAAFSPQRSMLYLSLGQRGPVDPDVEFLSLADVEYMLLCSDGLWDMLEDRQIEQILQQANGPAEASAALVEAANAAGGADNITVVVARF